MEMKKSHRYMQYSNGNEKKPQIYGIGMEMKSHHDVNDLLNIILNNLVENRLGGSLSNLCFNTAR